MRNIEINLNDEQQRIDRFLKKYLDKANSSLIQKFLRTKKFLLKKKNINL